MKQALPVLALLCLFLTQLKAQILFQEDFETDFEANGWQTDPVWQIGTSATLSSTDFVIPAHTKFAAVNDDGVGPGVPSMGSIVTAPIDLTGISAALLRFDVYFLNGDFDGVDETAHVLISTDSMATWQTLLDLPGGTAWQSLTIFLEGDQAGQKIHLAFEYDDNDGWNYGFCVDNVKVEAAPDYFADISFPTFLEYTVSTLRQLDGKPIQLVHQIQNYGTQPLNDISLKFKALVIGQGTVAADTHLISVPPGGAILDTFTLHPATTGKLTFQFKASHAELGNDFYTKTVIGLFELSDSTLARDDGEENGSIGMSFGDPNWYGYYGSEFDLAVADTLTGISVWMTTTTAGSFNLTVNTKDSTGLPTIELFHSNPIEINAGFSDWVHFTMPSEMPLAAGNYVFAVGQDTIQGVMGHGFDFDRTNPTYWIVSPVAGGGYPWFNWETGQTLMIRPHFKLEPVVSSVQEPAYATLKIYPNPTSSYVQFDFDNNPGEPFLVTLTDASGRVAIFEKTTVKELNISYLPLGLYFLRIQDGEQVGIAKVVKQ